MTSTNSNVSVLTSSAADPPHPLCALPREDLDLIASLVLHSGSLKGLAATYRVSYPTIRARLDRTIERVQAAMSGAEPDPFSDTLADLVQSGELSVSGARRLRDIARRMRDQSSAKTNKEASHGPVVD